jgi:hypothetical protein
MVGHPHFQHPRSCYVTSLAQEGITPTTIKTYLAAVRRAQVVRGFPEPRESSTLPRLRLIQNGIRQERARAGQVAAEEAADHSPSLASPMCGIPPEGADLQRSPLLGSGRGVFFGFFRAGEITVPSASAYDAAPNLFWGDVAISGDQLVVRVLLKRSKTGQFGRGTGPRATISAQ